MDTYCTRNIIRTIFSSAKKKNENRQQM